MAEEIAMADQEAALLGHVEQGTPVHPVMQVYHNVYDKFQPTIEAVNLRYQQIQDKVLERLRSYPVLWEQLTRVHDAMKVIFARRVAKIAGVAVLFVFLDLILFRSFFFRPKDDSLYPFFKKPSPELLALNTNGTLQDDPRLVQIIRNSWVYPPSNDSTYNLNYPMQVDFSMGQSEVVDQILRQQRDGFFVEVGALDGELRSNTLFFERVRNWSGLLIEAGPINFKQLLTKNRKTYNVPACISPRPFPSVMEYNRGRNRGRVLNDESADDFIQNNELDYRLVRVQCFPLYSMMLAINRTHIDYFSLDVEGVEMDVLETIPFDKLDITVLTVEFKHDKQGKDYMQQFMEARGYKTAAEVKRHDGFANDFVFVKSGYGGF